MQLNSLLLLATAANSTQATSTQFDLPSLQPVLVAALLIIVAVLVLWRFKQVIVNSILGVIALFLLQFLGISIPVNIFTLVISAALGLIGVGLMILLYTLGFTF